MATNREERLLRAREIIRDNPGLSKEKIATRLKATFGVGLRYSVILSEKRDIVKSSRRETPRFTPPAPEHERERPKAERQRAMPIAPTREQRIASARDIIRNAPELRKEEINDRLNAQFGVGLRHSVILKEKRGIFKESPNLLPEKNLARRYLKAIFGSQSEQRFDKLINSKVWTKKESLFLSQFPLSRLAYLEDMRKSRQNLINQTKMLGKLEHWTPAQYKAALAAAINAEYKERGWLSKKDGKNQIFRMIDTFRQSMIDEGKNPSPGSIKGVIRNPDGSIRFRLSRGDTRAQKRRYRELHADTIREGRQGYRERVRERGGRIVRGRTVFPR